MTLLKNNGRAVLFFYFTFYFILFYFIPQQFIILHLNLRNCFNWFLVGVIIFSSVRFLSKKVTKPKFFFFEKKNRNRVKPTGFGFLGKKPVQTGLARFFRFFPVLARFSRFGSVFFLFRFGLVFSVFCL